MIIWRKKLNKIKVTITDQGGIHKKEIKTSPPRTASV